MRSSRYRDPRHSRSRYRGAAVPIRYLPFALRTRAIAAVR
jgi:hypothetical protein